MSRRKRPIPTLAHINPGAKTVRGLVGLAHQAAALADLPLERPQDRPAPRSDDAGFVNGG